MAAVSHEPSRFGRVRLDWLELPAFWAALSIVVVWLAVLFVGVWGPNIVTQDVSGTSSTVPSVVVVAPCAVLATWLIARYAFRRPAGP